jgi:UPF0716 protein FxsA
MPYFIFACVLAYPFLEIMSLVWLADHIGTMWSVLWVLLTFGIGVLMLRHHRLAVGFKLMGDIRSGTVGLHSLFGIARYFIAALLFIIPGAISDVIAIGLLLPWGNKTPLAAQRPDDGIIEAEYREVDPVDSRPRIER